MYLLLVTKFLKAVSKIYILLSAFFIIFIANNVIAKYSQPKYAMSLYGDLKYKKDFKHFDYVNPNAPKGGKAKIATIGSFDNLNSFILKGINAAGLSLTYDSLMAASYDEEMSYYPLIAKNISIADDNKSVIFNINEDAKWHDGSSITADDVVFTFNILKTKGHPFYKSYYKDVKDAVKLDRLKVKFNFTDSKNKELPLLVSQFSILQKKYFDNNEFNKTTLKPLMGSGPYKIEKIDPGRSILYKRVENYWAKDLPVNIGKYNFDYIEIDYYKDSTVSIEALKAGEYDFRKETISKVWATAYNGKNFKNGLMQKIELPDGKPTGMQTFVFNLRKKHFQDPLVREALTYAFDFEWTNKKLFYGSYSRNISYFGNSIFASSALPSKAELDLLTPYKDILPEKLFTQEFKLPITDGSGNNRNNLIKAQSLLRKAGWKLKDFKLINPHTNQVANFEFLVYSKAFERVIAPYIRNLKRLGIDASIRLVDVSQFIKRLENFDYDIVSHWFTQSAMPGNEQENYWHSSKAQIKGSSNYIGIKNAAIDDLVEKIKTAKTKDELQIITKALDRVLLWNFYSIPQWHSRTHRLIYWNKFKYPDIIPKYNLAFEELWWFDKDLEEELNKKRKGKNG